MGGSGERGESATGASGRARGGVPSVFFLRMGQKVLSAQNTRGSGAGGSFARKLSEVSGEWSGFSSKRVCFFLKHIHLIQTYSHVIHVDSLIRKENLFQMLFTFILAFIRVIRL